MTAQEAYDITEAIIVGEEEAAASGNAYLDGLQVQALRVLLDVCNESLDGVEDAWDTDQIVREEN